MNDLNATAENLKKLISYRQLRLQKLKEVQAVKGFDTPVDIVIEIEMTEKAIQELQAELEGVELLKKNAVSLAPWHQVKPGRSIEITLHGDFSSFPLDRLEIAIEAFAGVMRISP